MDDFEPEVKKERLEDRIMEEMLNYEIPVQVEVPDGADAEVDPLMPIPPVRIKSENDDSISGAIESDGIRINTVIGCSPAESLGGDCNFEDVVKQEIGSGLGILGNALEVEHLEMSSNFGNCAREEIDFDGEEDVGTESLPKKADHFTDIPGRQTSGIARLDQAGFGERCLHQKLLPRPMPPLIPIKKARQDAVGRSSATHAQNWSTTLPSMESASVTLAASPEICTAVPKVQTTVAQAATTLNPGFPMNTSSLLGNKHPGRPLVHPAAPSDPLPQPKGTNIKSVSVRNILKKPFMSRTTEQKTAILNLPRPMPDITTPAGIPSATLFIESPWLCGCSKLKQFFCWPCLLFLYHSPESMVWCVQAGAVTNADIFATTLQAHEKTDQHREVEKKFSSWLETSRPIENSKSEAAPRGRYRKLEVIEKVRKNRKLLSVLVRTVCCMKADSSTSPGKDYTVSFSQILSSSRALREILKAHQGDASPKSIAAFVSDYAPAVEQSIETFVKTKILHELENTHFVSLFIEDFSSVVDVSTAAIIAHFIDPSGIAQQRVIGLMSLDLDRSSAKVFALFEQLVIKYGLHTKLAGFTYSATVVHPSQMTDFNEKVEKLCSKSKFFHYQNHDLFGLLFGALSHLNERCGNFFHNITALRDLFTKHLADTFLHFEFIESNSNPIYDFDYKFIITLRRCLPSVIKTFNMVLQHPHDWDKEVASQAPIFLAFLQDDTNRFLIFLIATLSLAVWDFAKALKGEIQLCEWNRLLRESLSNVFRIQMYGVKDLYAAATTKRMRNPPESITNLSHEVAVTAAAFLHARFSSSDYGYVDFDLVSERIRPQRNYFARLACSPETLMNEYRHFKQNPMLPKDLHGASKFFHRYDLAQVLPEMAVFLDFVMTIPSSWTGLLCPIVERIEAYRLSHTRSPISLESTFEKQHKELLIEISGSENLCESVIDVLATSKETNEFAYGPDGLTYLASLEMLLFES